MLRDLPDITIAATGTPQPLSATRISCAWFQVGIVSSTGDVRIGSKTVSASRGISISNNQFAPPVSDIDGYDLSLVNVVGTTGDVLSIGYYVR